MARDDSPARPPALQPPIELVIGSPLQQRTRGREQIVGYRDRNDQLIELKRFETEGAP